MPSNPSPVPVRGSERSVLTGARAVGTPPRKERLEVTLSVRPRSGFTALQSALTAERVGAIKPAERQQMTHEEFTAAYGADPKDLAAIEAFAKAHDLTVPEVSPAKRSVVLAGTVRAFSEAFGVSLATYEYWGGTYRGRVGALHVPAKLAEIVPGVFGLDDRPQAKPHFRLLNEAVTVRTSLASPSSHQLNNHSFTATQFARLYNLPAGVNGHGQGVAMIEWGGGSR